MLTIVNLNVKIKYKTFLEQSNKKSSEILQ